MRSNRDAKGVVLTALLLLVLGLPFVPPVMGDASNPEDMQAQNAYAEFNAISESTTISWDNIDTENLTIAQMLQTARYLVYRSPIALNSSLIENGSVAPFANISACTGSVVSCPGFGHQVTFPLPPGVNGTYYYGIATQLDDGRIVAYMELGSAQIPEPIFEYTHAITAPFSVNATFDPSTSRTLVQWINLNEITPGSLNEIGTFAYQIKVYRHLDPATRADWPNIQKELVGVLGAGNNSYTYVVPPFTDVEAYYSVTYITFEYNAQMDTWMPYEDLRFLGSNTLDAAWPVPEDNVAPGSLSGGVMATFEPEPEGGTGNTTIAWSDLILEVGATYNIWRSGSEFNNTTDPHVELIAVVQAGVGEFRYQVERGTLGYAYYAVTAADARGNHEPYVDPSVLAGPIMENAFDPWIAEPTNVTATYLGAGMSEVNWIDQVGAEGESYNIWHSWTKLSASSNLELEATLVATVPDGVQSAIVDVEPGKDQLSYYCVTSVTRYNHLNATYEDTGFAQNCIMLPLHEDTLPPAPVQLAQPQLRGARNSVLLSWINSMAEEGETYSVHRHLGDPFNGTESGALDDDDGWEVIIDSYQPVDHDTTVIREAFIGADLDRYAWYALTIADSWGNSQEVLTNRSNVWYVQEDTTDPTVNVVIGDQEGGALMHGDYRVTFFTSEALQEYPIIEITTLDYNEQEGTGTIFTPTDEITRAQPFLGSETRFIYDFPIASGIDTNELRVNVTMIDAVGNSNTMNIVNWSIDAQDPRIEVYAPSSVSTYLYGDDIRVHGAVTDDVQIAEVKYRFIDVREFFQNEFEWQSVPEVTSGDNMNGTLLVFDMREPSATFVEPGRHKLEIQATDAAGNTRLYTTSFVVDHCYENLSGLTYCESGMAPVQEPEATEDVPLGLTDPPMLFIITLGGANILLLLIAMIMGIIAAQDPSKKKKGGDDEFDEDDEWMMEFMGGGDSGEVGSAEDVRADLASENTKADEKKTVTPEEDDPFATEASTIKRRKKGDKKKARKKEKTTEDDGDEWDDDDDEWDDDDDDEKPKKKKRKAVKRRSVKRKSS